MKKIEAYIKSDRLKDTINKLKEINAPGFTYYSVTGHGREYEKKETAMMGALGPAGYQKLTVDIFPRSKIEVVCEDKDVEKIVDAIRGGCCTMKPGDGMAFISDIGEAYRLRSKEKLAKIE